MSTKEKLFAKRPNILIILTDQQRSQQHFPKGWSEKYLPHTTYLKQNGVTYTNNMCSSTACSPSRSAIFTSTYPTINGVLKVNDSIDMSKTLPMGGSLLSLGKMMTDAGYHMEYKGKWHLDDTINQSSYLRPTDHDRMMIEDDAMENHYDMPGWTSPDLGGAMSFDFEEISEAKSFKYDPENSSLNTLGAGIAKNDERIVNGPMYSEHQQSAVDFLNHYNSDENKPFCLVVSLANPHDIWVYPNTPKSAGYDMKQILSDPMFDEFKFELPESYFQDLNEKGITAQTDFFEKFQTNPNSQDPEKGKLQEKEALNYVKFYAYLQTLIDNLTGDLLNALKDNTNHGIQLMEDTLIIRLSDHGEMGMAQGGFRQKENNAYKETLKVPMVFSNPNLPFKNTESKEYVSLIDLMPTIAELTGINIPNHYTIQGASFAKSIMGEDGVNRKSHYFATDDISLSEYTCIRAIVDDQYKYAVYYQAKYKDPQGQKGIINPNGFLSTAVVDVQYELYDYANDPEEMENILKNSEVTLNKKIKEVWTDYHTELTKQMDETFTAPEEWELASPTS